MAKIIVGCLEIIFLTCFVVKTLHRLQLVDLSGRILKTISIGKGAGQTTIPLSGLPTGMYKLVWSDGKNKLTKSLLIK